MDFRTNWENGQLQNLKLFGQICKNWNLLPKSWMYVVLVLEINQGILTKNTLNEVSFFYR